MTVHQIQVQPTKFKVDHLLFGKHTEFDSWMNLCDTAIELAQNEAKSQLHDHMIRLTEALADAMIATAVEA